VTCSQQSANERTPIGGCSCLRSGADHTFEADQSTERHMGRYSYGNGVFDRRYKKDGSRSAYRGTLPFIYYMHHPDEPPKKWTYTISCETEDEAKEGKRLDELEYRNRKNQDYLKRLEKEKLRGYTVLQLIMTLVDKLKDGETMCDDRELNLGDAAIYSRLSWRPFFPSYLNLYAERIGMTERLGECNSLPSARLRPQRVAGQLQCVRTYHVGADASGRDRRRHDQGRWRARS
jgi:hypothetical protein